MRSRAAKDQTSSRPKVLMLGPELADQGGMSAVVNTYMANWDHSRYQVRYIGTYNTNAIQLAKPFLALRALIQFVFIMAWWRPEILHVHFAEGVSFYRKSIFVVLARRTPTRMILHCHGPHFDVFYQKRSNRGKRYIRFILNSADQLLVVADFWRCFFENLSLTVPVLTLYNSVALPHDLARDSGEQGIVLSLGRLGQRKGTYDILRAIPGVLEVCPNAEFWLGGDGEVEQVASLLATESWGKHARLLGWVRDEEKHTSLKEASIFLLPSYHEGLPVAILEAMAYGLPVISTAVGGIPEAVVDGETGFLIQPGDIKAIVDTTTRLLNSREMREQMGISARRRIEKHFEVDAVMGKLFALYDSSMSPG